MNLNTLIENRAKLLTDAQALLIAENKTAETRAKALAMIEDANAIDALIASNSKTEAKSENRDVRNVPGNGTNLSGDELRKAQENGIREYLLKGDAVSAETRSILTIGTGTANGGLLVPQSFDNVLHTALKAAGSLSNEVRTLTTSTGAQIKVAAVDDTAQFFTNITEGTAASESDPLVYGQFSSTDILTSGLISVSRAELQDSAFDVPSMLQDLIAKRWQRSIEKYLALGNSSNITAITPSVLTTTTSSPTAPSYADAQALYSALDPAYFENAVWACNNATKSALMTLVDTAGRPLFQVGQAGAFGYQQGPPVDTVLGKRVVYNQFMPSYAAAGAPALYFGDMRSAHTLRLVNGSFELLRLNERFAEQGLVSFIAYSRAGAYANLAGTSSKPVIALTQHA